MDDRYRGRGAPILAVALLALACGGGGEGTTERAEGSPAQAAPTAATETAAPDPAWSGPVDATLAARGEELFASKACVACHTVGGGRLVGPDLAGVTTRRSRDWVAAMITHPDSMIRDDPQARELFAEYMTPMSNQQVTPDELDALLEYLKRDGSE